MRRFEAIERIMEAVSDEIVVCNIGHPSQELFAIKDRPRNFYMLGSMGLASSIGLGLALATDKTVVAIEGDGAVLMNLSSLVTIGATRPKNYILVIIDNEAYGSTGFQPTFTSAGADLARIARACSVRSVSIEQEEDVVPALRKAIASGSGPQCITIKAEKGMPEGISTIPLDSLSLRNRFMESIGSLPKAERH